MGTCIQRTCASKTGSMDFERYGPLLRSKDSLAVEFPHRCFIGRTMLMHSEEGQHCPDMQPHVLEYTVLHLTSDLCNNISWMCHMLEADSTPCRRHCQPGLLPLCLHSLLHPPQHLAAPLLLSPCCPLLHLQQTLPVPSLLLLLET